MFVMNTMGIIMSKHDEEEKRKNSLWGKFTRKMKEISGTILEPEDE